MYLGGYEHEEHAAEAYDVAALKSKGMNVKTNFDVSRYILILSCKSKTSPPQKLVSYHNERDGAGNFWAMPGHEK